MQGDREETTRSSSQAATTRTKLIQRKTVSNRRYRISVRLAVKKIRNKQTNKKNKKRKI